MSSFFRFGITGLLATFSHILVLVALVEFLAIPAVFASLPAFGTALLVSYRLNYQWTFRSQGEHRVAFPRFILVALTGLLLNVIITFLIVNVGGFWYGYALIAVILSIPPLTYILSNFWVFESEG